MCVSHYWLGYTEKLRNRSPFAPSPSFTQLLLLQSHNALCSVNGQEETFSSRVHSQNALHYGIVLRWVLWMMQGREQKGWAGMAESTKDLSWRLWGSTERRLLEKSKNLYPSHRTNGAVSQIKCILNFSFILYFIIISMALWSLKYSSKESRTYFLMYIISDDWICIDSCNFRNLWLWPMNCIILPRLAKSAWIMFSILQLILQWNCHLNHRHAKCASYYFQNICRQ